MTIRFSKQFLQLESAGGIILFVAAFIAILISNSPIAHWYQQAIEKSLFIINEGLMALFFVIVGIELKRNYLEGMFSKLSQIILPLAAAVGGMIVPALIYCMINLSTPDALRGWATPVATDIAFAVGVLALFGSRIPLALKLFLLLLAIFDDIGAIIIIAIFYGHGLVYGYLILAALIIGLLMLLNRKGILKLWPYLSLGVLLWVTLFFAGIHPTIAGVIFALTLPGNTDEMAAPLQRLEIILHPWVAYFIMPLFALANAGISLQDINLTTLTNTIVLGIASGLFFGKQIGVMLFSWCLIKLDLAKLPEKTSWIQLYGVALLCGIGFTMSLFLGTLSFANESQYLAEVRLGVIIGSLLSGMLGAWVLYLAKVYRT